MATRKRLAWLFDVDGTLLLTGGAAREAFVLAVRDVLGRDDPLADIGFAGRIEPEILGDIFAKHGVVPADGLVEHFWESVHAHMRHTLAPGRGRLLPGVPELLDAVRDEPGWVPGLLTGNMRAMADMKLRHFGIAERFELGFYGDEAESRDALARIAVHRIAERFGLRPDRCVFVGDTEHDVRCARAAGARVVAVATGPSPREELTRLGPDLALDDLTDGGLVTRWARGVAGG